MALEHNIFAKNFFAFVLTFLKTRAQRIKKNPKNFFQATTNIPNRFFLFF